MSKYSFFALLFLCFSCSNGEMMQMTYQIVQENPLSAAQADDLAQTINVRLQKAGFTETDAAVKDNVLTAKARLRTDEIEQMSRLHTVFEKCDFAIYPVYTFDNPVFYDSLQSLYAAEPSFELLYPVNTMMKLGIVGHCREESKLEKIAANINQNGYGPRNVKFIWSERATPRMNDNGPGYYALYAVSMKPGVPASVTNTHIVKAEAGINPQTASSEVRILLNPEGAKNWAQLTTRAANNNNSSVALLLNNRVWSAPRVNSPILGGQSSITGFKSKEEADRIALGMILPPLAFDLVKVNEEVLKEE